MKQIKFLIAGLGLCFAFATASLAASPGVAPAKHSTEIKTDTAPQLSVHLGMVVYLDVANITAESGARVAKFIKVLDSEPAVELIVMKIDSSGSGDISGTARIADAMNSVKVRFHVESDFIPIARSFTDYPNWPKKLPSGWCEVPVDLADIRKMNRQGFGPRNT